MAIQEPGGRADDEGELFRLFVRGVRDYAIFAVDPEGLVRTWSRGAEALLGYAESEILGRSADAFYTPEDVQAGLPARQRREALETGVGRDDRWHLRKDGSRFWSSGEVSPLVDESGACRGFGLLMRDRTAWRHAEEARRASEERTRLLLDSTGEGIYGIDLEGRCTFCNPAGLRLLGYGKAEEVLGRNMHELSHHTRADGTPYPARECRIFQAFRRGEGTHVEDEVFWRPDGSAFPAEYRSYPIRQAGRVVGAVVTFLDLTGRKRTEGRLHREREWLRVTLASIGDAVIATDMEGRVTFLNGVAEGLTGWHEADAVGRPLAEVFRIVGEQTRQPVESPADRALRQGAVAGLANHTILIARDGTERAIDDSAAPIRDEAGAVIGAVLIFRDVDQRRRAERQLEASEARKAAILDSSLDAIITIDHLGRIVEWNPAAESIFGYRRAEAIGQVLAGLIVPPTLREAHRLGLANYLVTGEGPVLGRRIEVPAIRADGTEFPAEVAIGRISTPGPPLFTAHLRDITERAEAERALREGEERFRHLADAVPQVVFVAEPDGTIVYFNRRWYDYTGLTPEESLAPEGWRSAIHPDDLPGLDEAAQEIGVDGVFEAEYRIRGRDGDYRWHLGRAVPALGSGRTVRRYGTATDIDDRRRAEQTSRFLADASAALAGLVDYEETLRRVAGMAVPAFADWCAVDVLGEDGRLRRLAVTHKDPAKLRLAHELFEKYPPRPDDPHGVPRVLRTGEPELGREITDGLLESSAHDAEHLRLLRALGLRSYLCVPVNPRGGTPGVLTFVSAESGHRYRPADLRVAEDLARRATIAIENAELYRALSEADRAKESLLASLRDSEDRFRTMAESIPQLAWMARPDGHIYWYNRRWYEYTGTTPEQMEGWGWQAVHDPEILPEVMGRWRRSIDAGEPFDMVFPIRGGDGKFRPFLTRVMPVRGDGGAVAHWFGTNTDISDRLRIEEELRAARDEAEAASQAKTQFLAVLSHELRTPLNPILLATSAMLERPGNPDEFRPTLAMIRQYVNLQARLIDDLLDVMRIVRGKMPLHWEVVDAHRIIEQAEQVCRSEVFGKALRIDLDLAATRRHVNADPARLQQVFWNLIKNAVKFTPEGGSIAIRTRDVEAPDTPAGQVAIEVQDDGIGVEPGLLSRIFDPFQQGETTITRKFGGLGLGLAICKGVVEAHGGRIVAESEGRGRGTTFRVVLDVLDNSGLRLDSDPASDRPVPIPAPASLRILVVEDEPATLRLMTRLLRGLGHAVSPAGTIAEANEAVLDREFDLLVSDIGLPDGSGLDVIRRLVARHGPVPAIALTGYGMEEDILRSREAGFTAHMTKPIDFTKLEAMIRQVMPARA